MATLRENLRDHPGQSILTALASIATICSFIFYLKEEYCKKKIEEKKVTFFVAGKILNSTGDVIPNANYHYTLNSINYSDNSDYNGNYRVQIDTNKSFEIKIFCKIGHDSVSAFVKLTTSDNYPQNIVFPKKNNETKTEAEIQTPIDATNTEIVDNQFFPQTPKIQLPTYNLDYNGGNEIPYFLTDNDNELAYGLLSFGTKLKTICIPDEKNCKRIRFSFIDPNKSNQPILGWINIKYLKH